MQSVKRNILLTPGPATTTDTVKYAQVVPDICPREAEFGDLMEAVSKKLTQIAADANRATAVLFSGSGTAAVEAVLSSTIGDGTVIIVNNGAYGKRMCEIALAYGLHFLEFAASSVEPVDLTALEVLFQRSGQISHLAVVHHETTSGLLNDIGPIGELCRRYKADLIVDAISSFGAVPIQMDEMNINYLVASSNKNVQGLPGISFVIAEKSKLESLKQIKCKNYYLNLYEQYNYLEKKKQMRFTAPVQTLYALRQAITELEYEGVPQRYARYRKSWETLADGLKKLGLKYLVQDRYHSKLVTSIIEPVCEGYNFQKMHDFFYEKGITIYPGKIENLSTFRIANIGDISFHDIRLFLELLESYLQSIGYPLRKAADSHDDIRE
ncbi:2-aminoethylphosphonate aminotransferase [Paenibacillus larvae]